ncbi:MAG: hypothetical protein QM564_03575 [Bergeyella sp.]
MKKAAAVLFRSLKSLSFSKIMKLGRLTLPHPIFSLLSLYATLHSFAISKKYFPKTHSSNGIGNAFRHALWCCLIMMYCCKISSPKKSLKFCRRITTLHEELFPNQPLETKMDLHNNKIGMNLFMEMLPGIHRQFFEKGFFVSALFEKLKTAKILQNTEEEHGNELVYLEGKNTI